MTSLGHQTYVEDCRDDLKVIIQDMLNDGLDKKDAFELVRLIERFIDAKIDQAEFVVRGEGLAAGEKL
jgi:hypothetical protein